MTWCGTLRGRVKQYAVTNGTRTAQERKLARSGLGDLFDGVFISEVVGAEKPSLDFFRPVLEAIGPYDRGGTAPHRGLPDQRHGGRQPGGYPLLLVQPQGPAPPGPAL